MISSDSYIAYLGAKKSVDDRALNRFVWQTLKDGLRPSTQADPLRVIEFGAGIGTMFERVAEWGLTSPMRYTFVELNPDYINVLRSRHFPGHAGCSQTPHEWRFEKSETSDTGVATPVEILCADLYDVIADPLQSEQWDLIIAHAVMDLLDPAEALTGFIRLAKPGGLLYLSLIYDGLTEFLPSKDPEFERMLIERYHLSMDNRETRGGRLGTRRAAKAVLAHLAAIDLPLPAAGSSDWIVYPTAKRYFGGEAYFLETIIDTIDHQLRRDTTIDPYRLAAWAARKHELVKEGKLVFMARNMDFLVRKPVREDFRVPARNI
jgi:SAM-dependent methyltransferase